MGGFYSQVGIIMMDERKLIKIAQLWDKDISRLEKSIDIQGSPARSNFRIVVASESKKYILEEYSDTKAATKVKIHDVTEFLSGKISNIIPYLKKADGSFTHLEQNSYWHLIEYIDGTDLQRPDYAYDGKYAQSMVKFMGEMLENSGDELRKICDEKFYLGEYCRNLMSKLKINNHEIFQEIEFAYKYIEAIDDVESRGDFSFSHGDFHPLNIIWNNYQINTVIDWEFCNWKVKGYGYGLLVGCLGMEHPKALLGELVKALTFECKTFKLYFYDLVICIRLLWLSNWLHISDTSMINLEISYLKLLNLNRIKIEDSWF
jgi:homoserine kinase type II